MNELLLLSRLYGSCIVWAKIFHFTCLQAPHLNLPLLYSALERKKEGLFLAHLVLKLWKNCISVLDNTSTFCFFCHRLKTTLQIKIILWKKGSNLTFQNAGKGPLAVSQRLRDIPAPLTLEEAWPSRDTFSGGRFFCSKSVPWNTWFKAVCALNLICKPQC